MNELISVIVPVYNGEKYIKECIGSILNNSYKNIEVIIIDDGSNDSSYEICKKMQECDSRIKLFKKENEGIAKTRMYGMSKAVGKYLCFADQDDIVPNNAYRIMKNNIERNKSDLCIGSFGLYVNGNIHLHYNNIEEKIINTREIESYLIEMTTKCRQINYLNLKNKKYVWTIWNCMYKIDIIKKYNIEFIRFTDYEDDFLFNFNYIMKCKKISLEKEMTYYWRKNLKSESNSLKYIDGLYEKEEEFTKYIVNNLAIYESFEKEKWIRLSEEKIFVNAIINEANPKNTKKNNESILYLLNLFNAKIKDKSYCFKYEFNFINILKKSDFITYMLCRCKAVKLAYYFNKYIYYKVWFRIINLIKEIVY